MLDDFLTGIRTALCFVLIYFAPAILVGLLFLFGD